MRLQFVMIGQNLNWPCGRLSLARKKKTRREFMTLALARVTRACRFRLNFVHMHIPRANSSGCSSTLNKSVRNGFCVKVEACECIEQ